MAECNNWNDLIGVSIGARLATEIRKHTPDAPDELVERAVARMTHLIGITREVIADCIEAELDCLLINIDEPDAKTALFSMGMLGASNLVRNGEYLTDYQDATTNQN